MSTLLNYNDIAGHEQIIEHLQNAVRLERVSHAYILNGEKGSGKKLLANTFAMVLQCEERGLNPCGKCKSCKQSESGNHPDVIRVMHEKASIGVDDIRIQVNNTMSIKPYSSPYKIYIIDDADKMTEQAQNAILKTIEEPPAYAVIILLTCNSATLLNTIISRCVSLNLKAVSTPVIKEYLMRECNVPDYLAELTASFSQGNMGKAIKYATSEDFIKSKEEVLHILKYIDDMELYEVMDAIKNLSQHKFDINDYIDLMILWYRDVLMFKVTKNPNVLLYKDEYKYISSQASTRTYDAIEKIIKAMNRAKIRLSANVNFDIAIELMLLTLKDKS